MHQPIRQNPDLKQLISARYSSLTKEQLLRFRVAMDMSADAIYLVDRRTMRLIDVNETACTRMGYSRDELLNMGPQDLLSTGREELERQYDAVIAAGATGIKTESSARAKDGRKSVTELHRRALRSGDAWLIVSIARDITESKRAKRTARRIGRLYAVLSATNEAILRSKEPAELYQRVCDAAVQGSRIIISASVYTPDSDTAWLTAVAAAGTEKARIGEVRFSVAEAKVEGRGLIGTAFRTRKPCISNDILNDERLRHWREYARQMRHLAAVAVPLLQGGRSIGVLHLCADEVDAFDDESVALFERLGENVSFALDNFARKAEHERAEDQIREYVAKLEAAFMRTVEVTMTLSDLRDPYTAGHERRVAEIAVAIGGVLGFDAHRQEGLRVAGYLHDVGKMAIPAEILAKPGKLSGAEFALVKGHAQASHDILEKVEFPWPVAQVALQHHERLDGSGYPQGLKGEAILLEARILAVADVVEAMATHRPYRPGLGIEKALAEIERGRGSAYDPVVAGACLALFRDKGFVIPD